MQFPPQKIEIEKGSKCVNLIAFCEYEKFASPAKDSSDWFVGLYVYAKGDFKQYYIVYLNSDGTKVRSLCEAGSTFEYAAIMFMARYTQASVLSLNAYGVFLNENIFSGKLSSEEFSYKKELFKVVKKLEQLKIDVCKATNAL